MSHKEDLPACMPESTRANVEYEATKDGDDDDSHKEDESETLSDIDDREVDLYLHDEKGKHYKKILWELANREYLEKQATQLAASAHAAVAKSRKEKKRRRAHEAKNEGPAQSATEAAGQMLNKKRHLQGLKSKVNFDRLDELFNELEGADDPKKQKKVQSDPPLDNHDNLQYKVEDKNEDEMGSADEFEYEGDMGEMYQNTLSTENMDDKYFAEDDDYGYGQGYNDFDY